MQARSLVNAISRRAAVIVVFSVSSLLMAAGCETIPTTGSTTSTDAGEVAGETVAFDVAGLSCPLCAHSLNKQFDRMPGVLDHKVDLSTGRVVLTLSDGPDRPTWQAIERAVSDGGFTLATGPLDAEAIAVARRDIAVADAIEAHGATIYVAGPVDAESADAMRSQLSIIDGVSEVTPRLDESRFHVAFTEAGRVGETQLRDAVELFGYTVTDVIPDGDTVEGGAS
ncbi:MAG: heavy metal-associated domain-containing protein [Planctomycetota bacterium]